MCHLITSPPGTQFLGKNKYGQTHSSITPVEVLRYAGEWAISHELPAHCGLLVCFIWEMKNAI